MNKTAILPIITAVCLIAKNISGLDIGDDVQDAIADGILGVITLYGIVKNHFDQKTIK